MEDIRTINTLNNLAALVLAGLVVFKKSFGAGCLYAILFVVGIFLIQRFMASLNQEHDDSEVDKLMLMAGEPPQYMKRNIIITTILQIGLNVALSEWLFSSNAK